MAVDGVETRRARPGSTGSTWMMYAARLMDPLSFLRQAERRTGGKSTGRGRAPKESLEVELTIIIVIAALHLTSLSLALYRSPIQSYLHPPA